MASVSSTISTTATPDAVWAVASDPAAIPQWLSNHVDFPAGPPASLDSGTEYSQQVRVLGMPSDVQWSVTSASAPVDGAGRIEWSGQGPMGIGVTSTLVIQGTAAGSDVTMTQDFEGAAVMMVGPQLEAELIGVLQESLTALQRLAE